MSGIVGSYFNTRGSGVVAKLGTDGQVFTSTGAGLTQGFEAAAAGGAWTKIVRKTISDGDAIVEFDDTEITSTYKVYKIIGSGFQFDTGGEAEFYCHTKHDGAYLTHSYRYAIGCIYDNTTTFRGTKSSQNSPQIQFTFDKLNSDTAKESAYFEVALDDPCSTVHNKLLYYECVFYDSNGYTRYEAGVASNTYSTDALEGIKFYPSAGAWQEGEFTLYGITT